MEKSRVLTGFIALASALQLLSGCQLDTRSGVREQDEKQVIRKQVANLQATTADVNSRFQDLEDEVRKTNGRLEAVETRLQQAQAQSKSNSDKGSQALDNKIKDNDTGYREEFTKLQTQVDTLKAQLDSARAADSAASATAAASAKKDPFAAAEEKYDKKDYKEAILDYERYRKANSKGKQFSTATYKIGSAFQELGMIDEARAFYEEVVSKFPKSKDAARAKTKLTKLTKLKAKK